MTYEDHTMTFGPFSNVSPRPRSHWYGKQTMCVYDANGIQLCVIPRLYHYDREGKVARALSNAIAEVLTKVGFSFNPDTLQYEILPDLYPEQRNETTS